MDTMTHIPESVKEMTIVRVCIATIRIMWDSRMDKNYYNRVNWLNGMCPNAESTLMMLFETYATPTETPKSFARRLANIK